LSTKIHALVDALGNPLRFLLTPGQAHDLTGADALLPQIAAEVLIADKAYDADERVLKPLARAGKSAVIPPRQNRTAPRAAATSAGTVGAEEWMTRWFTGIAACSGVDNPESAPASPFRWPASARKTRSCSISPSPKTVSPLPATPLASPPKPGSTVFRNGGHPVRLAVLPRR
jgi:transposase